MPLYLSTICPQRDQRFDGYDSPPFEGGGRIPGQPVKWPAAVFLLSGCQRIKIRLDHVIGEEPARHTLGARRVVKRAMSFILGRRGKRDQLLFHNFRPNSVEDLLGAAAIRDIIKK